MEACERRAPSPKSTGFRFDETIASTAQAFWSSWRLAQWEVAGSTHNDGYLTDRGAVEQGAASELRIECADPMNDFPSFWVYNAALDCT